MEDENVKVYKEEISDDAICANMSVIIDRARKLGFETVCDYVEYLEYHNKYLRGVVHAQATMASMKKENVEKPQLRRRHRHRHRKNKEKTQTPRGRKSGLDNTITPKKRGRPKKVTPPEATEVNIPTINGGALRQLH
jgi:hypothetical protein